ncbi:hypothetical protein [Thermomonas aquatica]|uniref:Uncharacterized protein n=1 Tax=Thermomonas aquatica TaxID=2202149 RepID=A0A5B7ZMQ8_9GAMM|nr:hypothetical protein [Thermomonas aquatica]QDA56187.1 hypothetical protein FHQ07_02070 [Thermomonas aquatica]
MPRPKKPAATPAPSALPPSKTTHLFPSRKPIDRSAITHERIAADLEDFRKAGGKIEVLGVTRSLKKIGPDADDAPPTSPAKPRR